MSGELRAIETRYKGHFFRSRLEARIAVLLDGLKVAWKYEPQGYDLGGTYYLPDFYLPQLATWLEVKGDIDGDERYFGIHKAQALAAYSNRRVLMTVGDLPYPFPTVDDHAETMTAFFPNGDQDAPYWWCICPVCNRIGAEYMGDPSRLDCRCCHVKDHCGWLATADDWRIQAAYEAAISARFEHGEKPQVPNW